MGSLFYLTIISSHFLSTHLLNLYNLFAWPQQAWCSSGRKQQTIFVGQNNDPVQHDVSPSSPACLGCVCVCDITRNFTISVSFWHSGTIWGTKYAQNEYQAYRLNARVLCLSACQPKWVIVLEVRCCKMPYCDTFGDNPSLSCNSSNSKSTFHFSSTCVMNR